MTAAATRARESLERIVRQGRRSNRLRLPTLMTLAQSAGVAPATMAKAVAQFRQAGILSVSHGTGIRIADQRGELSVPSELPKASAGRKWQRLADHLRTGIVRGELGPGALLPSRKELGVRHGACFTTIRRALNQLVAEHYLVEDPKGFRVAGSRAARSVANTVVLVARGDSFGEPSLYTPRAQDHLRFLETACSRAGLRLEVVTCYYINTEMQGLETLRAMCADPVRRDSLLGFIVWNMSLDSPYLGRVLSFLAQSGKPVACLDEHGNIANSIPAGARRLRVFSMGVSDMAGRAVARYLLSRGHRHLAFIATSLSTTYASQRLRGLRDEYARAGVEHHIETLEADPSAAGDTIPDVLSNQSALVNLLIPGYVERTSGRYSVRERQIVRLAEQVSGAHSTYHDYRRLSAALERLYDTNRATVWVGATDQDALCALDLLRLKGTDAPAKVSVIGFDDGYEAFAQQLTSYNFGGPSYMNAMLNYVLRSPSAARGRQTGAPVELEGFVSERT